MKIFKKYKKTSIALSAVLLIIILIIIFSPDKELDIETGIVERQTVEQIVEETGIIESKQEATLSPETSGKVSVINSNEGSVVSAGQKIITLENNDQQISYSQAQAQLDNQRLILQDLENQYNKESVTELQNTSIENARVSRNSANLMAVPRSTSLELDSPTVSGTYTGPEGQYKLEVERTGGGYYVETFGVERTDSEKLSLNQSTRIGTHGLNIQFPGTISDYTGTVWYIDIPNKEGSTYATLDSAYQSALSGKDVAINQSEVTLDDIERQRNTVRQQELSLQQAAVNLEKTIIRAPFDGVVTGINVSIGENIGPATGAVDIISTDTKKIVVNIPESDISYISINDIADIELEAYENENFTAKVSFINPSARVIDGVSTLETTLIFDEEDERIRSGLSADISINTISVEDVIAVPNRAVSQKDDGTRFVRQLVNDDLVEIEVETGLRGSNGFVEIKSGLEVGMEIIVFISEDDLEKLEK